MRLLRKLIYKFLNKEHLLSVDNYVEWLRKKGCVIGDNLKIMQFGRDGIPQIDCTRPSLVKIGNNVFLNRNFTLLTHDYVTNVFKELYGEFVPSSGKVVIGNNVNFGIDCTVLKGVTIGDNCFIGSGSIVTKDIPANSVAVGRPAKVICSIEEYYSRRRMECIDEAFDYARSIKTVFGRNPVSSDFKEEFPLFVDARNISRYINEIPIKEKLGRNYTVWLSKHKAQFNGLEEFLNAAGVLD